MKPIDLIQILQGEFRDKLHKISDLTIREAAFSDAPNKIKVAIGMRRVGKTYFVYYKILQLLAEGVALSEILYINFEDDRLLPLNSAKLASLIEAFYALYPKNHDKKCYLFLDEIQNVDDWTLVIRRFHDSRNVELYLTGSSAKLLSKEIATSLRGRSLATEIWPYSFAEYLVAKKIKHDKNLMSQKIRDNLTKSLGEYLQYGGFPEVALYSQDVRQRTLQEYVDIVIFRDIVERYNISNPSLIKYMIMSMLQNVSSPFSINKFYNDLKSQGYKISKDSLYDYADYIEDAYLAFSVPIYASSIRKVQSNPKKIYAIDTGLVNALTLELNGNDGKLFENLIYLELRRAGLSVYYYLTEERYEVDFLVQSHKGEKAFIQVAWEMDDPETAEREQRALNRAQAELQIPGKIITYDSYIREGLFPVFEAQ